MGTDGYGWVRVGTDGYTDGYGWVQMTTFNIKIVQFLNSISYLIQIARPYDFHALTISSKRILINLLLGRHLCNADFRRFYQHYGGR